MSARVFLTADYAMEQSYNDQEIARHTRDFARQLVRRSSQNAASITYRHHHIQGAFDRPADVRRAIVMGYGDAIAKAAGRERIIIAMIGHGSDTMVDLAPAGCLRVTENLVRQARAEADRREAARRADTSSQGARGDVSCNTEVEALLALREIVGDNVDKLYFATCNLGSGTGPSLLGSFRDFLRKTRGLEVYGLNGYLWSVRGDGERVSMGVTQSPASDPLRTYHDTMWPDYHWRAARSTVEVGVRRTQAERSPSL